MRSPWFATARTRATTQGESWRWRCGRAPSRSLWEAPERPGGENGQQRRAAVADDGDQAIEVGELQAVVERVAEAVCPMEESEGDHEEQDEPHQQRGKARDQLGVGGGLHPPERSGDPQVERGRRQDECREHPTAREKRPEERLARSPHKEPPRRDQTTAPLA